MDGHDPGKAEPVRTIIARAIFRSAQMDEARIREGMAGRGN